MNVYLEKAGELLEETLCCSLIWWSSSIDCCELKIGVDRRDGGFICVVTFGLSSARTGINVINFENAGIEIMILPFHEKGVLVRGFSRYRILVAHSILLGLLQETFDLVLL